MLLVEAAGAKSLVFAGLQTGFPSGSMMHPALVAPTLAGPQAGLPLGSMMQPPLVHTPRSEVSACGRLKAGRAAAAHQGSAKMRVTARTAAFLENMGSSSREAGPAASNGRPVAPREVGCWSEVEKSTRTSSGLGMEAREMEEEFRKEALKVLIRLLRRLRGWDQAGLAAAAGMDTSSVCHYETGRSVPPRASTRR